MLGTAVSFKDLFQKKYSDFAWIGDSSALGNTSDGWVTTDSIRVAEYYRKTEKKDKLVTWISPNTNEQVLEYLSNLEEIDTEIYKTLKKDNFFNHF